MSLGRLAFAGAVLLGLAWFALRAPVAVADPRFLKHEFFALGTLVSVSAWLNEGDTRERGKDVLAQLEPFFQEYERTWRPTGNGALGVLNGELAAGRNANVPSALRPLFARAEQARKTSGGLFDARLGALVHVWGFDDEANLRSAPPAASGIAAAQAALAAAPAPGDGALYGPAPGVQWDFGGIAKGAAVEDAVARLKAAGIAHAIVNAGGTLRCAGQRGGAPWRIGIRHPRGGMPDQVLAYVLVSGDEAVMTSGDSERYFEHEGRRYHHLLDPRTGAPARGLQSVTVAHADAAWADAASTAVFVAGADGWRAMAAAFGVEQALVVTEAGEVLVTEPFAKRLKFSPGITPKVVR